MVCGREGCDKALRPDNRSGFCVSHRDRAAYNKALREANLERYAAQKKAYYEANREKHAALTKAWHEANPAKAEAKWRRRRARKLEAWVEDYTRAEVWARTGGLCHLCCEPVGNRWDVEHIVGLVIGGLDMLLNVAPAHPRCNGSKPKDRAVSAYPGLLEAAVAAHRRV